MRQAVANYKWGIVGASLAASMAIAFMVARQPYYTLIGLTGLGVMLYVLAFARESQRIWLYLVAFMFWGYAFFDRSFAALGVYPVLIGELAIMLGLFAAVIGGSVRHLFKSPIVWLWIILGVLCTLQAVPYFRIYSLDVVRDLALWYYGMYALLIGAFLSKKTDLLVKVPQQYAFLFPILIIWFPIAFGIQQAFGASLPMVPGSAVQVLKLKAGDAGVHLAGAATFMLIGLYSRAGSKRKATQSRMQDWFWWLAWLVSFMYVASSNRGGMLSVVAAMLVVFLFQRGSRWGKVAVIALVLAAMFFYIQVVFQTELTFTLGRTTTYAPRQVSPDQIMQNITSLVAPEDNSSLDNTKDWRLNWWTTIVNYTVFGNYFWTGKGFGINLAESDGFVLRDDGLLRSPHNSHLTFLARAGVPGFALWVALQLTIGFSLIASHYRARRNDDHWWAKFFLWILAYWVSFLVNSSFDVALEGPQLGIPFWVVIGVGLAAIIAYPSIARNKRQEQAPELNQA